MPYSCKYVIVRYVPDLIRNEPRNIGVVLQCPDASYIRAHILRRFKTKLPAETPSRMSLLRSFGEYLGQQFEPYGDEQPELMPEMAQITQPGFLEKLADSEMGNVQYSEVRATVAMDLNAELDHLYDLFVSAEEETTGQGLGLRLRTKVKRDLRRTKLLETDATEGFKYEAVVMGKSQAPYQVDFAHRNGQLHVVEVVDLTKKRHNAYEAAFKFEDLLASGVEVATYCVTALPTNKEEVAVYETILNAYSTVYDYQNGGKQRFLADMHQIVTPEPIR